MKTLQEVVKGIEAIEVQEGGNSLVEEVIIAFGDYEFEGETEVIVKPCDSSIGVWIAYINHEDSPEVMIYMSGNRVVKVLSGTEM